MITIKNLRFNKMQEAWDVRVDRLSVLGNPFRMESEDQRDSACDEYEQYFKGIVTNNWKVLRDYGVSSTEREAFMNELRRLYRIHRKYGKLNLFCWCAPKRCHAETIKKFLEQYISTPTKPNTDKQSDSSEPDCSSKGEESKTNLDKLADLQEHLENTRYALIGASRTIKQYLNSLSEETSSLEIAKEPISREIHRLEKLATITRDWYLKIEKFLPQMSTEEIRQALYDSIDSDIQRDRDADMHELGLQPYSLCEECRQSNHTLCGKCGSEENENEPQNN